MFTMRFWDSFGSHGVSCVKLPAAVAFPTDGRLLQRIEELRRALPANNMKPLWKSRELTPAARAPRERCVESPTLINVSLATVDRLPARAELRSISSQPLHIVDVTLELESPAMQSDPYKCVALARTAGSITRARDGISVSAA